MTIDIDQIPCSHTHSILGPDGWVCNLCGASLKRAAAFQRGDKVIAPNGRPAEVVFCDSRGVIIKYPGLPTRAQVPASLLKPDPSFSASNGAEQATQAQSIEGGTTSGNSEAAPGSSASTLTPTTSGTQPPVDAITSGSESPDRITSASSDAPIEVEPQTPLLEATSGNPPAVTTSGKSRSRPSKPQPAPPLPTSGSDPPELPASRSGRGPTIWQSVQTYRSHGSLYYRHVWGKGDKVECFTHIPGGNTDNPTAEARAEQVRRWIREAHAPEVVADLVRQWGRR